MLVRTLFAATAIFGAIASGPALAAGKSGPAALPAADVENARAALVFNIDASGVTRQKGIAQVTIPTKGIYCVKLHRKKSRIRDVRKTVPIVSGSAEGTAQPDVIVIAATTSPDCPANKLWLTVYTYNLSGAAFDLSDNSSWSLIIP